MGILRITDVLDWYHAALHEERALAAHPDDAGPIGTRAASPAKHSATWIHLDSSKGDLVYGPEIPLEVYRGHDQILPMELRDKLGMREISGWLFQVRKSGPRAKPDSFELLKGKEILLSKLPHRRNYFLRQTLKHCKHEKAIWHRVARAWDDNADIPYIEERLQRVLGQLSATPFVSHKGCVAAWAVAPERFDDVLGNDRFDPEDDYTVAALEIPFDDACELLRANRVIQKMLDLTNDGHLFDTYKSAAALRFEVQQGHPSTGRVYRCVTEELYKQRYRILEAACWAALCGRETPSSNNSVARSVAILYRRFAHNFVGREKNPIVRPPTSEEAGTNGSVRFEHSEAFQEEQEARDLTDAWRAKGPDRALRDLESIIAHIMQAKEGSIDEEFVSTLRPALATWPQEWKRPENFNEALHRLTRASK